MKFATVDKGELLVTTEDNDILRVDSSGKTHFFANIDGYAIHRGGISDMMRDVHGNIFVSFFTDGVIKINAGDANTVSDLGIKNGVFCLECSDAQDVVWVGSDCQGLYSFFSDRYTFRSLHYSELFPGMSHPVRALYVDKDNSLWIGTKGDGVLKIENFSPSRPSAASPRMLFSSSNSPLLHNNVFAFADSRRNLLWIAGENGINYYDYKDKRIKALPGGGRINFIHGIFEDNDSTLWLATLGYGVVKVTIKENGGVPYVAASRSYLIDGGKFSSNFFFSLHRTKDGRMLFANRGVGAFEIKGDSLTLIPLKNDYGTNTVRDVFSIASSGNTLWLGSGHGLLKKSPDEESLFYGPESGFINSTIHDMRVDVAGKLWISTNKGVARFDPQTNEIQTYDRNSGVSVMEYSDGAAFSAPGVLLFGGINGMTVITDNMAYKESTRYNPEIIPRLLNISGQNMPICEYLGSDGGVNRLRLSFRQNHFSVTFTAPDFLNASNYTFYYTLNGKDWINNGSNNIVTFNEMEPGDYKLQVKYVNRATNAESKPHTLLLTVSPPWYLSTFAKLIYYILAACVFVVAVILVHHRQRQKQERHIESMERQHKEEVYEEKLRFFTNITHEFCTPLTLIYGPCERILGYPGSDDYIQKYVELIRTNAERLNSLIQELIDFRRIETGHKVAVIRKVSVSELCNDTFDSFVELSERNNISYVNEIKSDLVWNSDYSCLKKILNNLISNAFKYTSPGGTIKVGAEEHEGRLRLSVYNTGKGVREEDKSRIFNRYTVLDNVEQNAIKGISSRNGLGMAICHSMVDMLHGTISINSEVGKFAEFIVVLPELALSEYTDGEVSSYSGEAPEATIIEDDDRNPASPHEAKGDGMGAKILVLDDNKEILTLLSDSLSQYNVITVTNAGEGLRILKQDAPDLIISDIMMPGIDGMEFARHIKGNRHTMHIPLVFLSAKTSNEEKIKGIEAGADAYIGKPFSISYLKAVVKQLLENRRSLQQYYNTSASSYEFSGGRLRNIEEKDFLSKVTDFIDSHMDDHNLSAEQVAIHLKMSGRNLYRKFKELGEVSPNDFIKNHRISHAGRLLLTTSLTVQEIIYRCGFVNRSHFYKEFAKRFGTTPKEYRTANLSKDSDL